MALYTITVRNIPQADAAAHVKHVKAAFGLEMNEHRHPVTPTVSELVSLAGSHVESAKEQVDELQSEMQEWYDNMPESFQSADKGSEVEAAASTLEELSSMLEVTMPEIEGEDEPDEATRPMAVDVQANVHGKNVKSWEKTRNAMPCDVCKHAVVTKLERASSRADRLAEAENMVSEAKDCLERAKAQAEENMEDEKDEEKKSAWEQIASEIDDAFNEVDQADFSVDFPGMY